VVPNTNVESSASILLNSVDQLELFSKEEEAANEDTATSFFERGYQGPVIL